MRWWSYILCFLPLFSCGGMGIEVANSNTVMVSHENKLSFEPNSRNTIKDFNESEYKPGYQYLAFFSGAVFQGKEIHAARIGNGHIWAGEKGVLVFYVINGDGSITPFYPNIDYTNVIGELRDPNITVSRDGRYLFLSSYSCDKKPQLKQSWLYIIDNNFSIIASNFVSKDYCIWGNTLETPEHYLLKTAYGNGKLFILRSNERIIDTFNLSFKIVHTFEYPGLILTEASMAYTYDKLSLIMRTSQSSYYIQTSDLSGQDGWSQWYSLDRIIHSPALLPYQESNDCLFMGGLVNNNSNRQPCYGIIDTNTSALKDFRVIDNGVNGFGGYPSFVKCGDGEYSTMYYDDDNNTKSAVYYQRLKGTGQNE